MARAYSAGSLQAGDRGFRPDDPVAHNNLGIVLFDQGRLDLAIDAYRRSIELDPSLAETHNNLGNALKDQGRSDLAIDCFERAVALRPGYAEAYSNMALALSDQGRLDPAIDAHRRAIELKPDMAEAHINLGSALKDQGRIDEAFTAFRTALAVNPNSPGAASNLLLLLHYHPEYGAQAILDEHRRWATRFAAPLAPQFSGYRNDRSPEKCLRVGYVSPDFRAHPVGWLLLPLFANHDRRRVEIVCYSDVQAPDALTAKLKALANVWHDTAGLSDPQVAERIRDDRIDVLVDLALHTSHNRMLVFARKPAPVQVTMLGLPATTGLATIDYRMTDPYLDPAGSNDADYTEQSIRLPHCFWIFQPPDEAPPVGALPAETTGTVTFGCLNQFAKVSRAALQLWVKILQSVPGARLVIQSEAGSHQAAVRALFEQGGIAGDRVEFVARTSRAEYFGRFHNIDLGLDPFPYNGHNSTIEALWMGVPVITLAGRTCVGRGGVSILSNLGLHELIAQTPDQYVNIAVACARDRPRLAALRRSLRQQMTASPLLDAKQYAGAVEDAFRKMWQSWCST